MMFAQILARVAPIASLAGAAAVTAIAVLLLLDDVPKADRSWLDRAFPLLFLIPAAWLLWSGIRDLRRPLPTEGPPLWPAAPGERPVSTSSQGGRVLSGDEQSDIRRPLPTEGPLWPAALSERPVSTSSQGGRVLSGDEQSDIRCWLAVLAENGILVGDVDPSAVIAAVAHSAGDWRIGISDVLMTLMEMTDEPVQNLLIEHLDGGTFAAETVASIRALVAISGGALEVMAIAIEQQPGGGSAGEGILSVTLRHGNNGASNYRWPYLASRSVTTLTPLKRVAEVMRQSGGGQRFAVLQEDMNAMIVRLPDFTLEQFNAATNSTVDPFEWLDEIVTPDGG
jgi:hypothetical protein